jgi:hypothetical protein
MPGRRRSLMNTNAVFDAASSVHLENVQSGSVCSYCHVRSSLRIVVAELLFKNQILRFVSVAGTR